MPTYTAVETCCCGAITTQEAGLNSILKDRLDEFRAAHAVCREKRGYFDPSGLGLPEGVPLVKLPPPNDEADAAARGDQ